MSLTTLAVRRFRGDREFRVVSAADLGKWARDQNLTPRQALEAALTAGIFPECYERNFPSLTAVEQLQLCRGAVLVAGLGGLGGTLAVLLARVGVGELLLADGDVFAPANLNRQLLATQRTLGRNKARVAAAHLLEINPGVLAEPLPQFLTRDNLRPLLARVRVVVDGLDTAGARRELAAAALEAGVPLVHGAVVGRFGQVTTLVPRNPNGLARLSGVLASEPQAPREVLAPTVTLTASLQVQEAVRLLLGQPPAYAGVLAHFDGDTGRLEILPLD